MNSPDPVSGRGRRFLLGATFAVVLASTVGCTHVKPWQRGIHSDYTMRVDRDPVGRGLDEHVFFSREAASGGRGVGGGGCGCN